MVAEPGCARTGRPTIVIVDAYSHSREGLGASLRGAGFAVETAGTAWQAITTMRGDRVGLAIIDLDLPPTEGGAIGGWDLVRIFRAFHPEAPVIAITTERGCPVGEAPAVEFLEKPVDPRAVRALVTALCAGLAG